jgi:hypothetical protein
VPWTGTRAAVAQNGGTTFDRLTLRQIVHTSISDSVARIELSSVFGNQTFCVSAMCIRLVHHGAHGSPRHLRRRWFDHDRGEWLGRQRSH